MEMQIDSQQQQFEMQWEILELRSNCLSDFSL